MGTCECGNAAKINGVHCARCEALLALELDFRASEEEIRARYRTLAKVWHPDRFDKDQSVREIAEDKLKRINSAFQFLSSPAGQKKADQHSTSTDETSPPEQTSPGPQRNATRASKSSKEPRKKRGSGHQDQSSTWQGRHGESARRTYKAAVDSDNAETPTGSGAPTGSEPGIHAADGARSQQSALLSALGRVLRIVLIAIVFLIIKNHEQIWRAITQPTPASNPEQRAWHPDQQNSEVQDSMRRFIEHEKLVASQKRESRSQASAHSPNTRAKQDGSSKKTDDLSGRMVKVRCDVGQVSIYEFPWADSRVLGTVSCSDRLLVLSNTVPAFLRVMTASGMDGYIQATTAEP